MRFVRNTLRVRQLPAVADHTRRMNRFTIRAFILIFITFYSVGSFYASVCLHHSIYFIVTNVANLNVKGDRYKYSLWQIHVNSAYECNEKYRLLLFFGLFGVVLKSSDRD